MNIACITLLMASAMSTSAAMSGIGSLQSTKRSFSFAGVHDEPPSPCAEAEQAAEVCLTINEPDASGRFETCIVEAEEQISCQTVANCAEQSIQTNACDTETTAVFNCWGCGICKEEEKAAVECITGAGRDIEDVYACFGNCVGEKDEPETCAAGCTILDECNQACLSGSCKSEIYAFSHCHLNHYGVDCTATCPAEYHESPVQSLALNLSRALKKNLRA